MNALCMYWVTCWDAVHGSLWIPLPAGECEWSECEYIALLLLLGVVIVVFRCVTSSPAGGVRCLICQTWVFRDAFACRWMWMIRMWIHCIIIITRSSNSSSSSSIPMCNQFTSRRRASFDLPNKSAWTHKELPCHVTCHSSAQMMAECVRWCSERLNWCFGWKCCNYAFPRGIFFSLLWMSWNSRHFFVVVL